MASGNQQETEHKAVMLWLLWKSRNEELFEGKGRGAEHIHQYSSLFLQEYQAAQTLKKASVGYQNQTRFDSKWKPPQEDLLKLNVNAVFKNHEAGIGVIVRDSKGEIQAVMVDYFPNCFDAQHAKSLGFIRALQFANEFDISHFELEGDALCVINKINLNHQDLFTTGHLIDGIRFLKDGFPFVKISYVHRSCNKPAHVAAKLALSLRSMQVWLMDFPQSVLEAVPLDLS